MVCGRVVVDPDYTLFGHPGILVGNPLSPFVNTLGINSSGVKTIFVVDFGQVARTIACDCVIRRRVM